MGVRSFMADCITDVALDEDTSGDRCTLSAANAEDTLGRSIVAVMGSPRPAFAILNGNAEIGRRASAILSRAQSRVILKDLTGITRDPDRQDFLTFVDGPWEGVWVVENGTPDVDDTITLDVRWDRPYAVSSEGVRKQ